jgi:hypothetical protein
MPPIIHPMSRKFKFRCDQRIKKIKNNEFVGVDCNVSSTLLRKKKKGQENYSREVSHRLEKWRVEELMLYIETSIFLFQHTKQ